MPKVLFLNSNYEDYLSDSLFHGLRTLLGSEAVDFPKMDMLYSSYPPEDVARIRGGGFTLYGLLDDLPADRARCLDRARSGDFDLVVFGDILRNFGAFTEWFPQLRGVVPMAVVDGGDRVEPYPYSGVWWRKRAWWFLPRAHRHTHFFKREITPWTYWFRSYLTLPPPLGERLGLLNGMRSLAFSIPEEKVVAEPAEKTKDFAAHVVDEEVAPRVGGQTSYAWSSEDEYVADLRASRFGITVKRAGWDCLRHYEIAANGAVPCFRDLDRKPRRCAPFGLDRSNCVVYRDADDLLTQVRAMDDETYAGLQAGAMAWARANTTTARAREFLGACGVAL